MQHQPADHTADGHNATANIHIVENRVCMGKLIQMLDEIPACQHLQGHARPACQIAILAQAQPQHRRTLDRPDGRGDLRAEGQWHGVGQQGQADA